MGFNYEELKKSQEISRKVGAFRNEEFLFVDEDGTFDERMDGASEYQHGLEIVNDLYEYIQYLEEKIFDSKS